MEHLHSLQFPFDIKVTAWTFIVANCKSLVDSFAAFDFGGGIGIDSFVLVGVLEFQIVCRGDSS